MSAGARKEVEPTAKPRVVVVAAGVSKLAASAVTIPSLADCIAER